MIAGCGAGLAGSSSKALANGESHESVAAKNSNGYTKGEHNATASWQNVTDVYDINSFKGWVKPGMDFDGYLQFPSLSKHPPKGFKYSLFGGSKSNWMIDTADGNTPVYKFANSDKGHVGIMYTNAAYYYNAKTMKRKPVSIRLTVTDWKRDNTSTTGYLRFHPHNIALSVFGNKITTVHLDVIGAEDKKIPLSFWDVDYGQHIRIEHWIKAYHTTPTKVVYERNGWFGGADGPLLKPAIEGTVKPNDPEGSFGTIVNTNNIDVSFGTNTFVSDIKHYNKRNNRLNHSADVKPGATIGTTKDITKKVKLGSFGNYFDIGSNKNSQPWTPNNTSTTPNPRLAGKYAGLNEKGTKVGTDWVKDLKVPKPKGSFYYNIRNVVYWEPAKALENFGVADNDFDPGLDIGRVKVYKQSYDGGKMVDRTNFFDISKGPHSVKVLAKPGVLKQDRFYNGIYNVVIKATPNSKFNYDRKQGDKFVGTVHNQAQYVVQPTPGKLTWTGKTNKVTVTVTSGELPTPTPEIEQDSGAKWVYKRREGTAGKNSWDMSNYDHGTVVAGQELHYRLAFRIDALKDTDDEHKKYTEATITDHLSSELDGSTVKNAKVSFNSPEGGEDISGGQTIKADASQFLNQMNDGGGVLYLNFDVRVKDNVKGGTVITNTGHAKIKADHQIKHYEDSYDTTTKSWYTSSWWSSWESYKSWNPSTNTTRNPVGEEPTPKPIKVGYALDRNFKNPQDLNYIRHDENFEYVITQRVPTLADDLGEAYKSFKMSDTLPKDFNLHSVNIYIKEGDNKFRDASHYGNLVKGQTVIFKGDPDKMPLKGETYALVIKGSYTKSEQVKPGQTVTNTATTHIDSPSGSFDLDSEPVTTEIESVPSSIDKSIDNIHDDYKNTDIDPGMDVMNPKDEYTVSYRIQADIGNEHNDSFSLTDNMPEHVHLVTSSIKQKVDHDIGYGEYQEGSFEHVTGSSNNSKLDLNYSGDKYYYSHITVTFDAKVDRESDWSDYYNANNGQMVYNNGTTKVTAQSYMKIPNITDLEFEDNTDVAMIPFNMGVQMFKTKQYIAQDDDKWSENLDPSHYNPVIKSKVRNDKSAVTTAIMLQMPNYMKLSQVKIMNTYKTPGFDKGWSSIRRANKNLIHDIENDNVNDLTNYDLGSDAKLNRSDSPDGKTWTDPAWHEPDNNAPAKTSRLNCPDAESYTDIQNTEDQDYDKDVAGRTYFFEQKWNPKTRYYHNYAKLGNMRTGFKATVYLKAESLGNRKSDDIESSDATLGKEYIDHTWSSKDELNDVGIHLSNIYGYTMLEDKATYSQDGKTLKYKTYGQFLGLAVDKDNKTVFKDPGKSWTKPDMDVNGNNPTGGYNDKVGGYDGHAMNPEEQPVEIWIGNNVKVLRLDSNVGTGDERVIENTTASPAKNVTNDYPSADKSDPATYDKTGHGTKKDDNSQFSKLDIMQFWTKADHNITDSNGKIIYYKGELMPKDLSHGYASGSDLTQTKGHSVTITIPRVDHDETLTTTRKDNIGYEPYKKYIINSKHNTSSTAKPQIDDKGFRTVDSNVNQTVTNPVKFITYYDFNRNFGGKSVTRVLREAYEVTAADSISAKAGYGITANHQLMTFTYGHDMARSRLLNDYRTNLSSKDNIFDEGYTKTANDEALNMNYEIIRDNDKINTAMQSAREVGGSKNVDVDFLVGGKRFVTPNNSKNSLYSLVRAREDWRPLLPNYRLTVIRYKFNDRILDNGKQAYALHDQDTPNGNGVEYRDYNSNIGGYNYSDSDVTKGGFRNYLKDWLRDDAYALNLRTTTTNKGLPGTIGFGVGYATDINFDQDLIIYGHRMKDEINIQPTISGREAQYPKIFNKNDENWLRHNDSGTLSQER